MKVSGQLHALAALPRGKDPRYPLDRRSRLDAVEKRKVLPCRESNPERPALSPSLYRLCYPDPTVQVVGE
jgi:hypothetical protein